jgi:hypothetical protein
VDIFNTLQIWNSSGTSVNLQGGSTSAGKTVNQATITQTGGSATLGAFSGSGNISIGNASGAAATMTVSSIAQNSVTINATGALTIQSGSASPNTVNALLINAGGTVDITNNHVIINYASAGDPKSAVLHDLATGYNGGHWNGPGIMSSTAAGNLKYAVGYVDGADGINTKLSSGQLEVAYTLYGDINLDGVVNGSDFGILAHNFGKQVTGGWEQGDLDYNGRVNASDFGLLAGNFGKTDSGTAILLPASDWAALDAFAAANGLLADVPEPASAAALGIAGLALLTKRRRATPGR